MTTRSKSSSIDKMLADLVKLCQFAGERFDLVQAGGGNASYQQDDTIWIKASGISLSEVTQEKGICELSKKPLVQLIKNLSSGKDKKNKAQAIAIAEATVKKATRSTKARPSIETLMHCLFGPFTLHMHPTVVTSLVCQPDWQEKTSYLFPDAIKVEYCTPGVMLAIALDKGIKKSKSSEASRVAFLGNHGLIVSGNSANSVIGLTDEVVEKLSTLLGVDWSHYSLSNRISELLLKLDKDFQCAYYCQDKILLDALISNPSLIVSQPMCPDQAVYCGPAGIEISSITDIKPIKRYVDKFHHLPKVIIFEEHLFLIGPNIKKCREMEEVLKSHFLSLSVAKSKVRFLDNKELQYLLNWDAEKYRQRV